MGGDKPYNEDEKLPSPGSAHPPLKSPSQSEADAQAPIAPTLAAGSVTPPQPDLAGVDDVGIETTLPAASPLDTREVESGQHFVRGSEIARGGMGRIIRAQDLRLGRPVAIKELLFSSPDMERRFEREIQITARLQHPAIIAVYEAGRLPSGLPFFSMKEVEGKPFDKVISATQSMDDRLSLLPSVIAVADALSYAHDRHIIHRDLKPANVLVGDYGETVVIDWGLAKDLRAGEAQDDLVATADVAGDDALTVVGEAMGTPAYMSPRQARGETVDQQADVYALGAMLYHLLAGQMPYLDKKPKSIGELLALVKSEAPARLSDLASDVPSDLLAVVDKAMARATSDRYTRAVDLAADLRRFQSGQRVGVHQYTRRQLVGRWMRRHLAAVSVAGAAIVLMVAGGVVSVTRIVREQRQTEVERKLAEEGRADAETFMDFMLVDVFKKLEPIGKLPLLETVAREASDYYKQRPEAQTPGDQERRATALRNVGDVLVKNDAAKAMSEYRASLAIWEKLAAQDPTKASWQRDLAASHARVGKVLLAQGDAPMAMVEYQSSLTIREELAAQDPTNRTWQHDLVASHEKVGNVLVKQGDVSMALGEYRTAQAMLERLAAQDPNNAGWQRDLSVSFDRVGDVLLSQGDTAMAMSEYRSSLAIMEKLAAQDPTNASWQGDLSVSHNKVGNVLVKQGNTVKAMGEYRAALAIMEKLAAQDPTNATRQRDLSVSHIKVGNVLVKQGDVSSALGEYRAAQAIGEKLVAQDPSNAGWKRDLSVSHARVGNVLRAQGDASQALGEYRASLAIREKLAAQDPTNTGWQRDFAVSHARVGNVLLAQGDAAMALGEYGASLAIREKLAAQDPSNVSWQSELSVSHSKVGDVLVKLGDASLALSAYRSSLAIAENLAAQDPTNTSRQHDLMVSHYNVGTMLVKQGDTSMALGEYRSAVVILEKLVSQDPSNAQWNDDLSEVRNTVADCCKTDRP